MMTGASGSQRLHFRQHFEPGHARHVDVGEDEDQRVFRSARNLYERIGRGHRKLHSQAPGTQVPTEMLAKQRLDVGLVVGHQNQDAQP
jgi:hypothetical protein